MSKTAVTKLKVNPEEFGIETKTALELTKGLSVILAERDVLIEEYKRVMKLEITKENVKIFRELRLKIRDNRTKGVEVWRKDHKEYFLRGGQFVDAKAKKESSLNIDMEEKLFSGEKHFENLEKERKAKLRQERVEALEKYEVDCSHVQVEEMDEETFQNYLEAQQSLWNRKQEEVRKQQEEEEKRQKAERVLQERKDEVRHLGTHFPWQDLGTDTTEKDFRKMVKDAETALEAHEKEQERLREEAEKKEAELAKEREAREKERQEAEAKSEKERKLAAEKLAKEQEERAKVQAELEAKEKAEEEARKKAEAEAEARKAAPDKEKLLALKKELEEYDLPEMQSEKGKKVVGNVRLLLNKIAAYIEEKA